ncbi:MAG: hypothetical protein JRM76_08280 [Nitrososphaerota archaeon]|nr:hypothetical protein [Nitrososphaerota archaeon]
MVSLLLYMVTANLVPVYLAPPILVFLSMIMRGTLSFHHLGSSRRLPRRMTREDWLAVYGFLGTALESSNGPHETRPVRPWRLKWAGIMLAASAALLLVPLPLDLPLSFAQASWNVFPVVQAALAGAALAASLMLAFDRPKRWLLYSSPRARYPYIDWASLKAAPTKEGKR